MLTVGTDAGTYTVTASVTKADNTKLTAEFTATVPQIITDLQKHSGDGQSALVDTQLSTPLTVKVLDQGGAAMSGVSVNFSVSPSGTLTATTVTTSTNGLASTALTLGNSAGTYTVTASVTKADNTKLTKTFTVTAEVQVATKLEKRSVDVKSVSGGTQLSTAFTVQVLDQYDAPMSSVSVSFSVSPSSGSVSRSSMTTGSNGQASTVLTVGTAAGTYTVTASVTKADNTKLTAEFTATVPQIITDLQKHSGDGQSALVGTQLSTPLTVKVLDQGGAAMSGVSVSFSVSPSGTLTATTTTTSTIGLASTALTLGNSAGTYTVTASVTKADNTKLTVTFTATAEAIPQVITKLEKRSGDGQSARVGTQLKSAFIVRVLDQDGVALGGISVSFSVSPSGTLSASTATTGTNGQASTILTFGSTTGTYTVTASVAGITETVSFTATAEAAPPPPPPERIATTLEYVSGNGQSAQVNTQLSSAFVVRVLDQDGATLGGVSVSFSVSPSGSLSATTATTNSNGQASTRLTFGSTTGTYTVTASVAGIAIPVSFTATAEAAPPPPPPERIATTLESVSGDGQSAQVNTRLSSAFVVRVLDQNGAALGGVSVSFSVSPSGSLSATTATTDSNGQASTILTFDSTTGTYTVTASVAGIASPVSFTATAEAAPPPPPLERIATTLDSVSGDGQSAQVNTQLSSAFVVRVLDQNGAALGGVSVSFSVSPSGSLSATTATTDSNGQASTILTFDSTTGTYTVTASVAGIAIPVSFTATAEAAPPPPPPERIATTLESVSGDGQSAEVNTQLSSAFVVRVLDQNGAALSGVSVSFSVSPSGSLSATTATTNSNGQASTRLTFGNTTGTYTVTARAAGISSTVSFTATAEAAPPPPPPERIATTLESVSGRGQSAQVNTQLNSAFVVRVLDQDGVALGGISVSFSVSPSGTLSASTATTGTNGQASTILTFGSTTGTYTVTASVAGITETVSFTATAEAAPPPPPPERIATTLEYVSGNGQSAQVNTQLNSAFVVRVLDQDGVALGGISVSFSVSPSGTLSASTATTGTNGQASTILTFGSTTAGTYIVTASVAGIASPVSFTATAEALPVQIPDQIVFSEIMFQSEGGLHSLPQWVEIRNTENHRVNLRGWELTLERRAENPIRIENEDILEVTVTFKEDFIIPPKYVRLVTTLDGRNSGIHTHQPERIYSLFDHHINELDLNVRNRNRLLDPDGFRCTLTNAAAEVIDIIGNLEDGETQWEFPDCYVNGVRSSMFRKFDEGKPLDGTVKENWVRAFDAKFVTPDDLC